MSKLDDLKKSGQIGASFGAAASPLGAPPGMDLGRATALPARLQGVAKDRDAALIPVDKIVRDEAQPREEFDDIVAMVERWGLDDFMKERSREKLVYGGAPGV